MLNHAKLAHALHQIAEDLFADFSHERSIVQKVWERITQDPTFAYKVKAVTNAPWPVPTWEGPLGYRCDVLPFQSPYYALSVDGSQIYPDRHQNVSCYVINVGEVIIPYGIQDKVFLNSEPFVFHGKETIFEQMTPTEKVNAQRQGYELRSGLELAKKVKKHAEQERVPVVLLYDGSLIFWHLAVHEPIVRRSLLAQYLSVIQELQQVSVASAWYISMPKSKELINLVRLALCDFIPEHKELYEVTNTFVDSMIAQFFLEPYQRSTVFRNNALVSSEYPDILRPYFFYIHVGDEIGRIEIPAWIARDTQLVDCIASIVLDQCIKGQGYPVVLSEAHEQAVVKGADRELFYYLIQNIGFQYNRKPMSISKKSFKKRRVGF